MATMQFLVALALGVASQLVVGPARAGDADTKDLDPKEVLKLAAETCTEQGDEERAQVVRGKLKALEKPPLKKIVSSVDLSDGKNISSLTQKALQEQRKPDAVRDTSYQELIVMPPPRTNPDPEPVPTNAVRLIFEYEGDQVRLVSQHPVDIAISGFDIAQKEQPGHFVYARDAAGRTLARVPIREAFATSLEVFPENHGEPIIRVDVARPRGAFTVVVPALKEADHVSVVRVAAGKPEARVPGSPVTSAVEGKTEVTELGSFSLTKEGR
jgi:hypothetical protein